MGKYWKEPPELEWYEFIVDGVTIGIMGDGTKLKKEKKRLKQTIGVDIKCASIPALIKFNAKTEIPGRILKKMEQISGVYRNPKLF